MSEQEKQTFLLSGDLLSISQAAKLTPYSAEYLSLRARTGKLEAVKITRDWVTTRTAVLKYVRRQKRKHYRLNQQTLILAQQTLILADKDADKVKGGVYEI